MKFQESIKILYAGITKEAAEEIRQRLMGLLEKNSPNDPNHPDIFLGEHGGDSEVDITFFHEARITYQNGYCEVDSRHVVTQPEVSDDDLERALAERGTNIAATLLVALRTEDTQRPAQLDSLRKSLPLGV